LKTKLTLTIDKSIIQRAKLFAKNTGRSLSEIIEHYLDITTQDNDTEKISPKLKKIVGAVKLPKNFDEENELRSYLENKHL
jgi:formiminotetrahydrofolate cyclodeaminase